MFELSIIRKWASLVIITGLITSLFICSNDEKVLADDAVNTGSQYQTVVTGDDGQQLIRGAFPAKPPKTKMTAASLPPSLVTATTANAASADSGTTVHTAGAITILSDVPAFDWSYGCSATAAAMLFGYYDRTGYSNMYAGPTNGGICPLNNSVWGHTTYPGVTCGECPLSATHLGVDSRAIKGHVDDYWIDYGNTGPDPYYGNWTEHTQGECTADYMGTSQAKYTSSPDGNTWFWWDYDGSPLYDYTGHDTTYRDGCHGMRLFAESRGYTVTTNFTQTIVGYLGNTTGFSFTDFQAEINAGRPVIIQIDGHSMLGYGYDTSTSTIYIKNTWDYYDHTMTWGGSYSGMAHEAVTVIRLAATTPLAPVLSSPSNGGSFSGTSVTFTWAASNMATQYRLQVNSSATFDGTSKYDSIVTGTSQAVTGFSNNGSTYYWRVYAGNDNDEWSNASSTYSFINGNTLILSRRIGIYRPVNHIWALDFNGNGAWDPGIDKVSSFGATGDLPATGKWDGLGATKVGIYRPAQKIWALDYNGNGAWDSGIDRVYAFGASGDLPVTGDWNGDGKTEVGIYRPAQMIWALDYNGNGAWNSGIDRVYSFGASGDTPVTGDWNGDGRTEIGIYRSSSNTWALDYNGNGAWDPGIDRVYTFGVAGDLPITGDWNGNVRAEIGIFRPSDKTWHLDYNGDGVLTPGVDAVLGPFGATGDSPVVGTTW